MKRQFRVLVISGGESKGIRSAGCAKACFDYGMDFDAVVATSIGPYIGALIAQGREDQLEKIFTTLKNDEIFSHKINYWRALLMILRNRDGMLNHKPIRKLLEQHVTKERPWPRQFAACHVNLATMKEIYTDANNTLPVIQTGMLASGNMNPLWETVWINGQPHVDGGVRTNSPLGEAIRRWDPTHITIINSSKYEGYDDAEEWMEKYKKSKVRSFVTTMRQIQILMAELLNNDIKMFLRMNAFARQAEARGYTAKTEEGKPIRHFQHILLEPPEPLGMKLDFERPHLFKEGYDHTMEILKHQ